MPTISRREFFKNAATGVTVAGFLSAGAPELRANPLGLPIGCQTWPVREMIAKDFPGTIKQLADAGFQTDAGVGCVSSHFGITELRENQARAIDWAKSVGLTQMMVPSLEGPKKPTMDEVKRAADEYNQMGERSANAGIQQGLHNEDFELSMV